jgi:putative protease
LNREELAATCCLAHRLGKKVYAAVNIFPTQADLKALPAYLEYLGEIGADAIIASDPGVIAHARGYCPSVPLHLSTQANTTNSWSALFWEAQGVRRINLARELSYGDLCAIRRETRVELEIFVHGAMCVSYSGRCLLSAFMAGRGANRGACTQPCRWSYALVEEKRPGEYFPVEEDSRGAYIFNSKDLCLIGELGPLLASGVDAFKIEGRMKGALYLASTLRSYRQALEALRKEPEAFEARPEWLEDLARTSHRPFTKGFLFPDPRAGNRDAANPEVDESVGYLQTHTLAGLVRADPRERLGDFELFGPGDAQAGERVVVEARSRLFPGMALEFLHPDGSVSRLRPERFEDLRGNTLSVAHANTWITFPVPFPTFPLQVIRCAGQRTDSRKP